MLPVPLALLFVVLGSELQSSFSVALWFGEEASCFVTTVTAQNIGPLEHVC